MIEAILFDHGALVDVDGALRAYVAPLLAKSGASDGAKVPALDEWTARWRHIDERLRKPYRRHAERVIAAYEATMRHFDLEAFVDDGPGLWRAVADAEVVADARSVLRTLSRRFRLGMVGDTDEEPLGAALGKLRAPLATTVCAEETGAYKPDPALWRLAIARLGRPPAAIVYVTSLPSEIAPARALDLQVALVGNHIAALQHLPNFAAADLPALAGFFD